MPEVSYNGYINQHFSMLGILVAASVSVLAGNGGGGGYRQHEEPRGSR